MERELLDICGVSGVAGGFVCDNAGEVIAASDPPVLATQTMTLAGRVAAQIFGAMDAANHRVDRIEVAFDTGRLFARDIGPAVLVVVCQPVVDTAMLRMAIDIAVVGWRSNSQHQKRLTKSKAVRRQVLTEGALDEVAWRSWRVVAQGT
ncbi:MAG: hypothetical protein ACKVT1_10015 [Dehalococcoidia bacterium]